MPSPNILNEEVGLLRRGAIDSYDPIRGIIRVKLNNAPSSSGNPPVDIPAPYGLFFNNGLFFGTKPVPGTPVVVGQGSGGQYYFVSFLAENLPIVPDLNLGELLIRANDNTIITLNTSNSIRVGSPNNRVHINTAANSNYISTNFYNQFNFTQASRRVEGLVKRDKILNTNYDQNSKLEDDSYDSKLFIIPLDPSTTATSIITGSTKNPPFVEQREMIYEFQYLSDVEDDLSESLLYTDGGTNSQNYIFPNRRKSRSDTLSLTLASPNYLMEVIKGTVVDIFGNILDINRNPLPVGQDQNTIRPDKTTDKVASFFNIKELERKSLAYHFEINARKDLTGKNGQLTLPDITSNADYARLRSRFFIDIDKEGQFKLNVPASSEKGNIPLLTRYENYSTFGPEDNNNPNKLIFREDNLDIFQDSFAAPKATPTDSGFSYATERGSITIKSGDADGAPIDRITGAHIKHGTVYHDILQTCYAQQNNQFINYQAGTSVTPTVNINDIPELKNVVSDTIKVSGSDANAGGRSGSINFDGSIELNIGANTVDRQSLWLDTAGGMVANIGRDLQNKSAAISMNGDVYMQIGGFGVVGDSRFVKQNNGSMGAVLDLRVFTDGGYVHMIRCDKDGITIMTPGNLAIHAKGNMKLSSDANIEIDCETLTLQQRMVLKGFGGSI
jgi:hypothetical protein